MWRLALDLQLQHFFSADYEKQVYPYHQNKTFLVTQLELLCNLNLLNQPPSKFVQI